MYRPHRLQTSRARWQMPRHSRPRKLRADAQRRRLTQHCAHQISCALYLCRQRRAEVSSPRWNPRRCRTNTLIFARIAAAKGNDRAQFTRAHFPEDRDLLERSTISGHYLVERDFQLSIECSRPSRSDSLQKANSIFERCFLPDWPPHERERTIGFHKSAPSDRDFRITE